MIMLFEDKDCLYQMKEPGEWYQALRPTLRETARIANLAIFIGPNGWLVLKHGRGSEGLYRPKPMTELASFLQSYVRRDA